MQSNFSCRHRLATIIQIFTSDARQQAAHFVAIDNLIVTRQQAPFMQFYSQRTPALDCENCR